MRCELEQEVGVGCPAIATQEWRVARHTQGITQRGNAHQTHGRGEITHVVHPHEGTHGPVCGAEQAAHRNGRVGDHGAFAHDQIRAPFEPASKFRHQDRRIGEVALHQQHGIPSRISRGVRDVTQQGVGGTRIPQMLCAAQDTHRHGALILLGHCRRLVRARVVVDDDFVLARKLSEHCAEPPQQDADGGNLVVRGDGEVEHGTGYRDKGAPRKPGAEATGR